LPAADLLLRLPLLLLLPSSGNSSRSLSQAKGGMLMIRRDEYETRTTWTTSTTGDGRRRKWSAFWFYLNSFPMRLLCDCWCMFACVFQKCH
jgi:hypothetical protein